MKIGRAFNIKHSWLLWGPWALFALGFVMNAIVMAFNKAQMPVLVPGGRCDLFITDEDFIHSCLTAGTRLRFLADWIVVNHRGVFSPGDFFEMACDFTCLPAFITWLTVHCQEQENRPSCLPNA